MRHRILSSPGEAIQPDRQSSDSYDLKIYSATNVTSLCQSVNLPSKSVFSCSKWPWRSYRPMNCRYTQSCHSYSTSLIFKRKRGGDIPVLANFKCMCISLWLRGKYNNRIYTDGQKGPTDVKSCSHTPCLSTGVGAAQQEHTIPPTARHPAVFIESLPPANQTDSKKKRPIIITSHLCRRHVRPGEWCSRSRFIHKLSSFEIQSNNSRKINATQKWYHLQRRLDTNKWQDWMTTVPKFEFDVSVRITSAQDFKWAKHSNTHGGR